MDYSITVQPSLEDLKGFMEENGSEANIYPVFAYYDAIDTTPHMTYLKLVDLNDENREPSFLSESSRTVEQPERYAFIGFGPRKVLKTGETEGLSCDPLELLQEELKGFRVAENVPGLLKWGGGAVGYVSYDCVQYFEPKVKRPLKDVLQVPEAILMLFDTIIVYDHVYQRLQIVTNIHLEESESVEAGYEAAAGRIGAIVKTLRHGQPQEPNQKPIKLGQTFTSSIGREGYEGFVSTLKEHVRKGDIFQAVTSQRVARPTSLHPFNIYKQLRTLNPSPYMFYIDFVDFQVVGASPELLCKVDGDNEVVSHPIAGTIKRGANNAEDELLQHVLQSSDKDRAEHIMLVDLARNDINRVCDPSTTRVTQLLKVQKFSHVHHLVSEVRGTLREGKTAIDAFRSVFPAGTVSGAPKVRAMELIAELEGEKRGVYAGAVGYWSYDGKAMDTCIALRTMVYKDGVAYLQAGGGVVFDSDEYEEYMETINKMKANERAIIEAEKTWADKVGSY